MSDPIETIVPGKELSPEDKQGLADANREATEEAHRLAAEHRARDEANMPPLVNSLADSIKDKLKQLPPEEKEEATE